MPRLDSKRALGRLLRAIVIPIVTPIAQGGGRQGMDKVTLGLGCIGASALVPRGR
jgi:hypothetical protein